MTMSESFMVALFCMVGVFSVLLVLYLIIKLFSFLLGLFVKTNKPKQSFELEPSQQENSADEEDFSSGKLILKDVDEPTAAMIMAIVSDESGIPLSELQFKSIKLLKED